MCHPSAERRREKRGDMTDSREGGEHDSFDAFGATLRSQNNGGHQSKSTGKASDDSIDEDKSEITKTKNGLIPP